MSTFFDHALAGYTPESAKILIAQLNPLLDWNLLLLLILQMTIKMH
jgi:hypothetical protein